MTVTLLALHALLALGATLMEPASARRIAFTGLVPFALGVASYAVSPGSEDLRGIAEAAGASGGVFFTVNTGLLLLGVVLCAAAAMTAIRRVPASFGRALALLGGSGFALWRLGPLVGPSGGWRVALAAVVAAAVGAVGGGLAQRLRRNRRGAASGPLAWPGMVQQDSRLAVAFGFAAAGSVAGPNVAVVFLSLAIAAGTDFLDRRRRGGVGRVPWLLIASIVLGPVWWLMATIAGPVGLGLTALVEVPFSAAAETALALPVALVSWAFLGLWPAHRLFPGGLLAPLGIALWLRVASPALAGGLHHWQPALVPLGVLGIWGAAVTARRAAAWNALAFLALASEAPSSGGAVLLLGAAALALGLARGTGEPGPVERLGWTLAALALPFAFEAGLRAQVTYTLAAGAGAALAFWIGLARAPDAGDRSPRGATA